MSTPVASAPAPAVTLDAFAGSYRLIGETKHDGCAEGIYLAARNIVIDAAARSLYADVVDRRYDARIEADALIAEGRVPGATRCSSPSWYTWKQCEHRSAMPCL